MFPLDVPLTIVFYLVSLFYFLKISFDLARPYAVAKAIIARNKDMYKYSLFSKPYTTINTASPILV